MLGTCKLMLNNCSVPENNAMKHFVPFRRIMTPLINMCTEILARVNNRGLLTLDTSYTL